MDEYLDSRLIKCFGDRLDQVCSSNELRTGGVDTGMEHFVYRCDSPLGAALGPTGEPGP